MWVARLASRSMRVLVSEPWIGFFALLPIRTRACCLAVGVSCDGDREALGIWWQDTERAKFWLAVLNDLNRRGVADV
jgi:Transposase, Mutator family